MTFKEKKVPPQKFSIIWFFKLRIQFLSFLFFRLFANLTYLYNLSHQGLSSAVLSMFLLFPVHSINLDLIFVQFTLPQGNLNTILHQEFIQFNRLNLDMKKINKWHIFCIKNVHISAVPCNLINKISIANMCYISPARLNL